SKMPPNHRPTCLPSLVCGGMLVRLSAAAQKKALDDVGREIEQRKADVERMRQEESSMRSKLDKLEEKLAGDGADSGDRHRDALRRARDKKEQDEAEERNRAEERKMEQAKREAERERLKIEAEAKAKAEARQAALDAAQQKQQAILAQPPVVYYP